MSTRPVPTNLDSWPGIHDLVSTYKHMLHVLWSSPSQLVSVIGVGRPGTIEHLSKATRLDEPVVLEALRELERRGLLVLDEETRELAVRRWCAFHKFSGRWAAVAELAFNQVSSPKIKGVLVKQEGVKELFPLKSDIELANSNSNSNSNINSNINAVAAPRACARGSDDAAAPQSQSNKRRVKRASGIVTWTSDDLPEAEKIEHEHSAKEIIDAVLALLATGKEPVPGLVARAIQSQHHEREAAERKAATAQRVAVVDALAIDPLAAARGEQILADIRRKSKTQSEVTTHD